MPQNETCQFCNKPLLYQLITRQPLCEFHLIRMIDAAPDLYAALAELHDWIIQSGQSAQLESARAALRKARGESPDA